MLVRLAGTEEDLRMDRICPSVKKFLNTIDSYDAYTIPSCPEDNKEVQALKEFLRTIDSYDVSTMSSCLRDIAQCAFYLAGDDQLELAKSLERWDTTEEEYDPEETYIQAFHDLCDTAMVNHPLDVVTDEELTALLKPDSGYEIFKIVLSP